VDLGTYFGHMIHLEKWQFFHRTPIDKGSSEKMTNFQIGHMTNVSIQIRSSIPQYDGYKVSLNKNEWKVPFGGGQS
jgi:hypothetical protein